MHVYSLIRIKAHAVCWYELYASVMIKLTDIFSIITAVFYLQDIKYAYFSGSTR